MSAPTCTCCQRTLNPATMVALELDQRINGYHNLVDVPSELSQGWFDFGAACAKRKRAEAARLLLDANLVPFDRINILSNISAGK